eukprot:5826926-Alexandrium_andersonii.AAC.1
MELQPATETATQQTSWWILPQPTPRPSPRCSGQRCARQPPSPISASSAMLRHEVARAPGTWGRK